MGDRAMHSLIRYAEGHPLMNYQRIEVSFHTRSGEKKTL